MNARTVLRRAWNDNVWSKVIAAAITAALAGAASMLAGSWYALAPARHQLLRLVEAPITVPAWSLAAFGILIALLAVLSCWASGRNRTRRDAGSADDIQPNAIPIVEARLFACPLALPTPTTSPAP